MSTTNPDITTQWDDIHRKLGNFPEIPKKQTEEEITSQIVNECEEENVLDRISLKSVSRRLNELENTDDCENEKLLHEIRAKRIQELKMKQIRSRFGQVIYVNESEFVKEVTDASKETVGTVKDADASGSDTQTEKKNKSSGGTYVVVNLYDSSLEKCKLMNQIFREVAARQTCTKFVMCDKDRVLPKYASKNLPLLLIYYRGICEKQIICERYFKNSSYYSCNFLEYFLFKMYKIFHTDVTLNQCRIKNQKGVEIYNYDDLGFPHSSDKGESSCEEDESDDELKHRQNKGYTSMILDKKIARGY